MEYTSDILTGGTPSAISEHSAPYLASKACDNNESTRWSANSYTYPSWWKYDLGSGVSKKVRKLRIHPYADDGNDCTIKDFKLQGSNDDSNWTDIYIGQHDNTGNSEDYAFENGNSYRYYRIYITTTWEDIGYPSIFETEMMELIEYGLDILNDGTPSADSEWSGYPATKACDNNESTGWTSLGTAMPHWWKYDFGVGVTKKVRKLRLLSYFGTGGDAGRYIKDFKLQGSNDDSDWTDIYTGQEVNEVGWHEYIFLNDIEYRYYRVYVTSTWHPVSNTNILENEMMEEKSSPEKTILSDAELYIESATILSDAELFSPPYETILSDSELTSLAIDDINNKVNIVTKIIKDISNIFVMLRGYVSDISNDFRIRKLSLNYINNDVRFLASWQRPVGAGFQSLGKGYIKVYIGNPGVEQIDVDVDSISINRGLSSVHTASFDLARTFDGAKPNIEDEVEIKYGVYTLYRGYITSIIPSDNPESITINCQDENWKKNRDIVYFLVGHKPIDAPETYYSTIKQALLTEFGWNLNIGDFVPETINCYSVEESNALTSLIDVCGNYSWFYDVNKNKKLWTAGAGDIIDLNIQELGKNIKLYDVISHQFKDSVENLVNKFKVTMGGLTWNVSGTRYEQIQTFLIPAWDKQYETINDTADYDWTYPDPEKKQEYDEVFTKYSLPELETEFESWTDVYEPYIIIKPISQFGWEFECPLPKEEIEHWWGSEWKLTGGFTIDWATKTVTFNEPVYYWKYSSPFRVGAIRSPEFKIYIYKKEEYSYSTTPNPFIFETEKMGDYTEIIKDLNLSSLKGIGGGYWTWVLDEDYHRVTGKWRTKKIWISLKDDTEYATDYANWQLSKVCDEKLTGDIEITLDALCFYNIDLDKRIRLANLSSQVYNINSISIDLSSFTARISLENHRSYKRTKNLVLWE